MELTYLLTNLITGDTYVGSTRTSLGKRLASHKSRAKKGDYNHTPLYANINKYGWDNFKGEVLCEGIREEEFISKIQPTLNTDHDGKGRQHNAEQSRAAGRTRMRPVLCVETGIVYESAAAAARSLTGKPNAITNACRGVYKTAAGYHWEYC